MQFVTLKSAYHLDIAGPIWKYVKSQEKSPNPVILESLNKIQKQRELVERIKEYKSSTNIADLKCYLAYLEQISEIYPLMDNKIINITYTWGDGFTSRKCSCPSILYEKASVMYNIGALYTQLAYDSYVPEDLTQERICICIDALQNAALYFNEVCGQYSSRLISLKVSEDMSNGILSILRDICIVQGQHLYFLKARNQGLGAKAYFVLLKVASDQYYSIRDQMMKLKSYFPSGLIKHFELESAMTATECLHYYGEVLMEKSEEHSGTLYKLAEGMKNAVEEVTTLASSFRMEYGDQIRKDQVLNLVKTDVRDWYNNYRIFGGIVPSDLIIPNGARKMEMASDLALPDVPLSFPLNRSSSANSALDKCMIVYLSEKETMKESARKMVDEANRALAEVMSSMLLPDILTADGCSNGLPNSIETRLVQVDRAGGLKALQSRYDVMATECMQLEEMVERIKSVEGMDPMIIEGFVSLVRDWKLLLDDINKAIVQMNNKPIIFAGNPGKLAYNLPTCTQYPTTQGTIEIQNACDTATNLQSRRRDLINRLNLDKSGEMIVRQRMQGMTHSLNLKTVVYEATQPIKRVVDEIQMNIDSQRDIINNLKSQYARWNSSRRVTPEMARREEVLRDVVNHLNMYDRAVEQLQMIEESRMDVADALEKLNTMNAM